MSKTYKELAEAFSSMHMPRLDISEVISEPALSFKEHKVAKEKLKFKQILQKVKSKTEGGAVNPEHYKKVELEAIEVMEAFSTPEQFVGHLKLTALKYILRLGNKDSEVQEIGKAIWYLELLREIIKEYEKELNV